LSNYRAELSANLPEFFWRSSIFFYEAMEVAVLAFGITRMRDFKRNAKRSFSEMVSEPSFGQRKCSSYRIHMNKYYYAIE
jgi:hypothetical protein